MRQSHQKSRSRGRNRKPQNPMSRNYESNGPDVKIRGNAGHIADKYSSLARDALSNGDTVMAENYWQHAEHYNRIIAAAQAQKAEENAAAAANGRGPQPDVVENSSENTENQPSSDDAGETVQAEGSDSAADEPKERKNGRGRRTRRAAVAVNGESSGNDGAEEASDTKDSADEKITVEPEIISEDAASLPQSITGGLQAEES